MTFSKKNILLSFLILGLLLSSLWQLKIYQRNLRLLEENKKIIAKFKRKKYQENPRISVKEGEYVPDFVIQTIDNKYVESKKLNYPLLLLFFNTDCRSCLKSVVKIHQELSYLEKEGLLIIGLATENKKILSRLRENNNVKFLMAQDLNSKFHKMFGIRGEPSFVLISPIKRVVWVGNPLNYTEKLKTLPEIIEDLLKN